ncbi:hypothetical protein [Sulfitobacter sp. R18_1]|uniref:hypothetical protein n=1 Tax=Sulfitobacter sp. R18_1 TaxID=2821104 RepID=UPI001AD9C1AE|nr:hypothetical protein [Sulfitobacter sp. R18_1]MBO9428383.1 hypothetical protein [Sulfitobacter sp. R18_1]
MPAQKSFPSTHSEAGETLAGLITDARTSLSEIETEHTHTATLITTTLDRIEDLTKVIPKRAKNMKTTLQKWQSLPRRVDCPPLRLLFSTEIDGRGVLKASWTTKFDSYDDQQAFHALLMTGCGPGENSISAPRFRELIMLLQRQSLGNPDHLTLALRYAAWSGILLGRLFANSLGEVVPTAQVRDLDIDLTGKVHDKNLEYDLRTNLTKWLEEHDHLIPLPLLHHAYLTGMSATSLRDMCRRSDIKEVSLLEIGRALKNIGSIVDYNRSWWRTGSIITLPEAKGFALRSR